MQRVTCIYCGVDNPKTAYTCEHCGGPIHPQLDPYNPLPTPEQMSFGLTETVGTAGWEVIGVDVSEWQGEIDWDVLVTKAQFAIIRAGYGNTYVDAQVDRNRQACLDRNFPFGLYWYMKPDKNWQKHGDSFFNVWKVAPGVIEPTFDSEEDGGLAKTALESWMYKSVSQFNDRSGRDYEEDMMYTSPGFANRAYPLTNWMKHMQLDVAHWTSSPQPSEPNEWEPAANPDRYKWLFWQHAVVSSIGYGVKSSKIDLQRCRLSLADFNARYKVNVQPLPDDGTPPPPPPSDDQFQIVVTADPYLNYRTQPGLQGIDLGDLMPGTRLTVVQDSSGWLKIVGGYIHPDYVRRV